MEIEVSLKVRSAIKAKLLELGVHVDDELPDYIMVLVANRRSKPQMESDLELFLSENTQKFTTWLFHVLKKLEKVTLADSIAVLSGKEKAATGEAVPQATKEAAKSSQDKAKSSDSSAGGKHAGKTSSSSSGSKESGKSNKSDSDKHTKKKAETTNKDERKDRKHSNSGSNTSYTKSSEKSPENKVQFKLKNNLVKQTEFDRKQAAAVGLKGDKSSTELNIETGINISDRRHEDFISGNEREDVLNLGGDEAEDLFDDGDAVAQEVTTKGDSNAQVSKAATDDEEDVEKLRKIALQTKSPTSRRKLGSGNVTALRGMVMNIEKENSTKRKRGNDEVEPRESKSESKSDSPQKKLRSVIAVTTNKPTMEEYDPEQPKIHKLSSVICVTSDKRPKRDTTSMNSNLILKAMKAVEVDNIKRPLKSGEDGSKRKRDNVWEGERTRSWRIARSPRSRSRDGNRRHSRDRSGRDRENRRVRRDSSRERSHRVSRNSRATYSTSRSPPLQLFTRRSRMNIRDRLGSKQVSRDVTRDEDDEDLMDKNYLSEIRDIENDLNIIINVPNLSADNFDEDGKDCRVDETSPKLVQDHDKSPTASQSDSANRKSDEKGYVAPNRISIQVMNSSDDDESDSDEENERKVVVQQESESEAELEVTVNHEQDIDDLLPPQPQQSEDTSEGKEEKKTVEEKPDRLTDLRAKLAAITRANTASYSPLTLQPPRPAAPNPTLPAPIRSSVPYFTPYFYDSLPRMIDPLSSIGMTSASICKFWPTCSFGDSCKFTHPKCKFGDGCAKRPNCPFKHDSDAFTPASIYKPPPPAPAKKLCHFFPKCNSMDCIYYHPKPCRYGVNCTDANCIHYHPGGGSIGEKKGGKLPALHKLKWSKDKAVTSTPALPKTGSTVN